jgi:hypothetical protein
MKTLAYFASLTVLATGIAFAQSSGTGAQSDPSNSSGSSSAQSSQSPKMTQSKPSKPSDAANPDSSVAPATSPSAQSPVPNATVHDQPSNSSSPTASDAGQAQPRSGTMGTTGKTPENTPAQSASPDQQPKSSDTPNSGPPRTSLNDPGMLDGSHQPTEELAALPQKPAHAPDAGTQPNPEAVNQAQPENAPQGSEAAARSSERENANTLPQTSSLLPLLGLAGMSSLVGGMFLRVRK